MKKQVNFKIYRDSKEIYQIMDDSTSIKIIDLTFDYEKPLISLEGSWIALLGLAILIILIYLIKKRIKKNNYPNVEMEVEISGTPKVKFKAKRDDSNIYIANRIYIELVTRKAAIPINKKEDVIIEVYNSWYKLFSIIREEVKNVPGHYLRSHNSTNSLIGLSTRILNEGLRPHLTKYQAEFRKWYDEELKKEKSKNLSPQQIQSKYEKFDELIEDAKKVNQILIDYSIELKKLIKGK